MDDDPHAVTFGIEVLAQGDHHAIGFSHIIEALLEEILAWCSSYQRLHIDNLHMNNTCLPLELSEVEGNGNFIVLISEQNFTNIITLGDNILTSPCNNSKKMGCLALSG